MEVYLTGLRESALGNERGKEVQPGLGLGAGYSSRRAMEGHAQSAPKAHCSSLAKQSGALVQGS